VPGSADPALAARLQALFLEELDEKLGRLEGGLEELAAAQPEVPPGTVGELFRAAHSLKGAAQAVGATAIAASCHDLEEEFAGLRDCTATDAATLTRLQQHVDAVARHRARPVPATEVDPGRAKAEADAPTETEQTDELPPAPAIGAPRPIQVAGHKIEALAAQAGDLITASYGFQAFLGRLHRLAERMLDEQRVHRRDRETVLRLLAGHPESNRVATLLEQAEARQRAALQDLDDVLTDATAQIGSLRTAATSFADASRRARMVPFEHATSGLARQVRELCSALGKQAELEITASEVEVDKELVLMLRETLGHLVRNALDHGIERPEERVRTGKDPRGRVRIDAALASDGIRIDVHDDGRGVDAAGLKDAAARRDPDRYDGRAPSLVEAMFTPGVSTAKEVSSVSGRGVGLDAVRAAVESTGGSVVVHSEPAAGTTFTLSLPLNLSTMRALLVRAGDQLVCFPSASVERLVPLPVGGQRLGSGAVVAVDDEIVPMAALADVLGWEPDEVGSPRSATGLVAPSDVGLAVLAVDEVVTELEIVVQASSSRLGAVRMILGTAQLDDGRLALVLNPRVCLRSVVTSRSSTASRPRADDVVGRAILLAEDSLTTRELERSLLEAAGYTVFVANDGQQAWDILQSQTVDAVVSDVNMPRMDGIALCRAMRTSSRLASLPVVLVTSLHSDADRRAGLDAGADAYLTKVGFNRGDLLDTLERLL